MSSRLSLSIETRRKSTEHPLALSERSLNRRFVLDPLNVCCVLTILFSVLPGITLAQSLPETFTTGPAIPGHGPVATQPDEAFNLVPGETYRVVFDVASGSAESHVLNRRLESVARFVNLHARAGIDPEDLQIEVVTHGGTLFDMLSREAYARRFEVEHPNADLLEALIEAGVTVYLCGQSASARGVSVDELAPGVKLAHSAMTVLVRRQSEGWALLP